MYISLHNALFEGKYMTRRAQTIENGWTRVIRSVFGSDDLNFLKINERRQSNEHDCQT